MDRTVVDKVLAPVGAEETKRREQRVRGNFWRTTRRAMGALPFMDDVVASYFCALDHNTPARAKGILIAALAYFVMPLDMVPDFIVGLGFTDDAAVLMAAISAIRTHITPAHHRAAKNFLDALE